MMYPPSDVCWTDWPASKEAPPKVLSHTLLPSESVFISQASHPSAPSELLSPAMIYPPSDVCRTDQPASPEAPPKVLSHTLLPSESVFISQTSRPPAP